jgi:hypothetical protein
MIKAVANFFAGVIGIFIILALIAIVMGVKIATDTTAAPEFLYIGVAMVIGGGVALFAMGMSCVLLDIMFNTRKISANTNVEQHKGSNNVTRSEPELG